MTASRLSPDGWHRIPERAVNAMRHRPAPRRGGCREPRPYRYAPAGVALDEAPGAFYNGALGHSAVARWQVSHAARPCQTRHSYSP